MPNFIDRFIGTLLDRPYIKARLNTQLQPRYLRAEVRNRQDTIFDIDDFISSMDELERQRLAMSISWIFADIDLIAAEIASTDMKVISRADKSRSPKNVDGHALLDLFDHPNEFMSRTFLLRYLVFWLSLSRNGAFLFLSPNKNNLAEIVELWPINSNRITPVRNAQNYLTHFIYKPLKNGRKPQRIDARYVLWLRYPNIFDYYQSYPPLMALIDAMAIELGINASQKQFYTESRGIPMSIVSTPPDISTPDFEQFRADLRDDWENNGTTVAIARGGTLDVKSLGFTQKDLEILGNQELTRDRIDSVLLRIPFRSDVLGRGEGLKQADRWIKDKVVYPLHKMIAEQISLQLLHRFYGNEFKAVFDDVRAQDKAIAVQERNVNARWYTVNEMRSLDGMDEISFERMPEYGSLPVQLATNPSFVASFYGLGPVDRGRITKPDEPGNMPQQMDGEMIVNQNARNDTRVESIKIQSTPDITFADIIAIKEELKQWRTVMRRNLSRNQNREFVTKVINDDLAAEICTKLEGVTTREELDKIFSGYIDACVVD